MMGPTLELGSRGFALRRGSGKTADRPVAAARTTGRSENGGMHGHRSSFVQQLGDDAVRPPHPIPRGGSGARDLRELRESQEPGYTRRQRAELDSEPGGEKLTGGLLREVLKAVEGN